MAENADINLRVGVQGIDQANRSLKDLVKDVNRAEGSARGSGAGPGRVTPSTATTAARAKMAGGGGGAAAGMLAGAGAMAVGHLLSQGFSALKQSLTDAFDPLATSQERNVRMTQAGLNAIPLVGDLASGIYGNLKKGQLTAVGRTRSRLSSEFGEYFAAGGDPEKIKPLLDKAASIYGRQEKARFAGEEAIAAAISRSSVFEEEKKKTAADGAGSGYGAASGDEITKQLEKANQYLREMGEALADLPSAMMDFFSNAGRHISEFARAAGRGGE
jgi:hypothetical protein